jgi:hypothetical protein
MCWHTNNNNNTTMSTTTMSTTNNVSGHIANVPYSTSSQLLMKRPRDGNSSALNSNIAGIRRPSGFRTKATTTTTTTKVIRSSAFPVVHHHHHPGSTAKHARESQDIGESPTKKLQRMPVTFGCPLFPVPKQQAKAANTATTLKGNRNKSQNKKKKFFKVDMSFMDAMNGVEPLPTPMDGVVRLPQQMFPFVNSPQPMRGVFLLPPMPPLFVAVVASFPQPMDGVQRLPQQMFPFVNSPQPMRGVEFLPFTQPPLVAVVSSFPQPMDGVVRLPQQMFPFVDSPQFMDLDDL